LKFGELKFGELKRHPDRNGDGPLHAYNDDFPPHTHQTDAATMEDPPSDAGDDIAVSWSTVTRRYRPNHRPAQPRPLQSARLQNSQEKVQKEKRKLFGTARDSNNAIKSGVEIIQKRVAHIDNLGANCTPELLKENLLSKDITVLSCFVIKSWLKGEERDKVTAFRVCILADHRAALMNPNLWSKGIILRDWKFKGKDKPQHGTQSR